METPDSGTGDSLENAPIAKLRAACYDKTNSFNVLNRVLGVSCESVMEIAGIIGS